MLGGVAEIGPCVFEVAFDQSCVGKWFAWVIDIFVCFVIKENKIVGLRDLAQGGNFFLESMIEYPTVCGEVDGASGFEVR